MMKHKHTFDKFRRQAEVVHLEQQTELKGGYAIAPVQGAVGVSNVVWTEIDIRNTNLKRPIGPLAERSFERFRP